MANNRREFDQLATRVMQDQQVSALLRKMRHLRQAAEESGAVADEDAEPMVAAEERMRDSAPTAVYRAVNPERGEWQRMSLFELAQEEAEALDGRRPRHEDPGREDVLTPPPAALPPPPVGPMRGAPRDLEPRSGVLLARDSAGHELDRSDMAAAFSVPPRSVIDDRSSGLVAEPLLRRGPAHTALTLGLVMLVAAGAGYLSRRVERAVRHAHVAAAKPAPSPSSRASLAKR